jgi:hypothetical protein
MNKPLVLGLLLASSALSACGASDKQRADIKLTVVAVTDVQSHAVRQGAVRFARLVLANASAAPIELSGIKNADGLVVEAPVLRFDRKFANGKWNSPFKDAGPPSAQALSKVAVAPGAQVEISAMLDQAMGTAKFPDATWRACVVLPDRSEACSQDFSVYSPEKKKG